MKSVDITLLHPWIRGLVRKHTEKDTHYRKKVIQIGPMVRHYASQYAFHTPPNLLKNYFVNKGHMSLTESFSTDLRTSGSQWLQAILSDQTPLQPSLCRLWKSSIYS